MKPDKLWLRGVLMICITTGLWGFLPIFLKFGLKEFAPDTIAWFRFNFAFSVLLGFFLITGRRFWSASCRPPVLGALGGVFLAGNYYMMTEGIHLSGPSNSAVLIQIAPVLLTLVSVVYFGERLTARQATGLGVCALGFLLFFKEQNRVSLDPSIYSWSSILIIAAAVSWVGFMICQKLLSQRFDLPLLSMLFYGTAAFALAPFANGASLVSLDWRDAALLIFLGANTLIAYGALAEAVKYIPLTLISVITALNPLLTMLGMQLLSTYFPGYLPVELITVSGYVGAFLAISGVVLVVWAGKNKEAELKGI